MSGEGQTSGGTRAIRVVATILERTAARIESAIARAEASGADAVEVRFDAAPGADPEALGRRCRLPLVATCRPIAQGGLFDGGEADRILLLERAAGTGRFRLDVELGLGAERIARERPQCVAVLSCHLLPRSPDGRGPHAAAELLERARVLLRATGPGQVAKLVDWAGTAVESLRAREVLDRVRDARLAVLAMGPGGHASRILAGAWGSAAVWGAADPAAPGASGQIPLEDLLHVYRVRSLTKRARLFGLAGQPVEQSLSPRLHNAVLARAGLDAVYLPLTCADETELRALCEELPLRGVSVTAPLKVAAMAMAGRLDPTARDAGSLNTLVRSAAGEPSSGWWGANLDGRAAREEIADRIDPAGRTVTIVGAGGAARGVAAALSEAGSRLVVASRRPDEAAALARAFGAEHCPLGELRARPDGILVQATSAPREVQVVPDAAIGGAFVLDLRYGSGGTALVQAARRSHVPAADGLGVLLRQAAEQVRLFTGLAVSARDLAAVSGVSPPEPCGANAAPSRSGSSP